MKLWLLRGVKALAGVGLTLAVGFVVLWWVAARVANADEAPPSAAKVNDAFQRSVGWLKLHEAEILGDGNVALWWMIKAAADRSHDPYLADLVQRSIRVVYAGDKATLPWRRIVEPNAVIVPNDLMTDGLSPYQRFYYFSATCRVVEPDDTGPGSQQFLDGNTCRPIWGKVIFRDKVCSTHQLLGIRMARNSGCKLDAKVAALESELLEDIAFQLKVDPVITDPYIQRVLTLYWVAGPQSVKPVWLRRVIDAQQPDGGWSGDHLLLGVPQWLQPATWRQLMSRLVPSRFNAAPPASNFHATAQGVLLMALALHPQ
ncbi:MAG: hypothetical protein EKK47_04875 [Burkholderiales bacterium]|nr:MAG: hypothetical protein EKK47_04875 [Burkholderiales bacterium]